MSSLYQLVGERLALQNTLEQSGYDAQTISDTLDAEGGNIESKFIDYCYVLRNLEVETNPYKDEIERLSNILDAKNNAIDAIKKRMLEAFIASKYQIIKGDIFTIKTRNNPPSVIIDNEALIPADYFKQALPPPPTIDKTLIKKAISDGFEVSGARLETKQRLVIE